MRGAGRQLRAELYRLSRSPGPWLAALFLAAVSAVRVLAVVAAEAQERLERAAQARQPAAGFESGTGWAPFAVGWRAGLVLATFLLILHAARSLAHDREAGLLRVGLARGVSRGGALAGRFLAGPLLVLLALATTALGAWIPAALYFDFGPLVEEGYELASAQSLARAVWLSVALLVGPLVGAHAFGLLVSALARGSSGAVAVALALFLAFDLTKDGLGRGQYLVFAGFCPSFLDRSALEELVGIARGFSDAGFDPGIVRTNFFLVAPQALLLALAAGGALSRRAL